MTGVRAFRATRWRWPEPAWTPLALVACAVLLGYVVATRGPAPAAALIVVPGGAYLVLRRPLNGLLLGAALILVVPYWYTLGVPQAAVFRIAALLALASCLFASGWRPVTVDLTVFLLAAVTFLGWLLRSDRSGLGPIVVNQLLPLGFYVSARVVPGVRVPRVMLMIFAAGVAGALSVYYEAAVGHAFFVDEQSYSWNASDSTIFRAGGVYGSPPGAATVLAMSALCGLPFVRSAVGRRRALSVGCLALIVGGCIVTFTRASVIGLGAGLLVYLWLSRSPLLRPSRVAVGAALVCCTVLLVLPALEQSTLFQRGVVRPGNLAGRASYWRLAIPIAETSAANLSVGIGSARMLAARQGGSIPAELAAAPVLIDHGTHNQYVLALVEQGLVGLGALVAWLAATVLMGVKRIRAGDPATAALVGSMIAFAVVLLANNAILHPPSFSIAAMTSGLLAARIIDRPAQKAPLAGAA
jgi:O-antigen ligase